jgi:hypothetical protein
MSNMQEESLTESSLTSTHIKPAVPKKFLTKQQNKENSLSNEYLLLAKRTTMNQKKIKNIYLPRYKLLEVSIESFKLNPKQDKSSSRSKMKGLKSIEVLQTSTDRAPNFKDTNKRRLLLEDLVDNNIHGEGTKEALCVGLEECRNGGQRTLQGYFKACKFTPKAEKVSKHYDVMSYELTPPKYRSIKTKLK